MTDATKTTPAEEGFQTSDTYGEPLTKLTKIPPQPVKDVTIRPPKGVKVTAPWLAKVERDGFPTGAMRITVKDTDVRGLELRLSRTGSRAWALSRRFQGQQRRWSITATTLAEARDEARKLIGKLVAGLDPVAVKRAEEAKKIADAAAVEAAKAAEAAAKASAPTLREIIAGYERVERPGKEKKKTKSWAARRAHIEREYREFLDRPAVELTETEIIKILDAAKAREANVSGARGPQYLLPLLSWAALRGMVPSSMTAPEARKKIEKARADMRHKDGDRILDASEIVKLWRAWEAEPDDHYSRIMRFALVTGQRRSECAALRWSDVNLATCEWWQTVNKSNRPITVPLSSLALEVMGAPGEGLVFPSRGGSSVAGWAGNWSRAVAKYSRLSGVSEWSVHDLRRTFASMLAEMKVDRVVVELLLNHSPNTAKGGAVAAIYNRHSYTDEKREAVERLARHLRGLLGGSDGNVIELHERVSA